MKKYLSSSMSSTKRVSILIMSLFILLSGTVAKAQFPGYTMTNYINNVVQFPANFAPASTADITDTLLTTCWYNVGYPAGAGILHMTWNTPFFNGPGEDVLIAIWNDNASGSADVRFQLADNSYTSSMNVNFLSGLIMSGGGVISPVGYNTITGSVTTYPNTPRAKLLDISAFYNGPLAVKGIEFSGFITSHIDLLAISTTQNASPLPLMLSNFQCSDASGNPLLQWQTKTEKNSSHFEVEKSADGIRFSKIHDISAAGNSNLTQNYSYTDMNAGAAGSKVYYRLKMVDTDEQFIYSEVRSYRKNVIQNKQPLLFQNPAKNEITFHGGRAGTSFALINAAGKVFYSGIIKDSETRFPSGDLPDGIYYIQFAGNKSDSLKISIAR